MCTSRFGNFCYRLASILYLEAGKELVGVAQRCNDIEVLIEQRLWRTGMPVTSEDFPAAL